MAGKAKGILNDFLDSTRGEYERAMYGRRTTEDLDIVEATPEAREQSGDTYNIHGDLNIITQNPKELEQEIDDDMDI